MNDLTLDQVRRVARLARLALPNEHLERSRSHLAAVLDYMQQLRALDTTGVEPLARVSDDANRLDDDTPGPCLPTDALLAMAPRALPPFIQVPRVLGDGGAA
ncbi:MAG: Asp-tRNA(Asn)/Glu-tRNA(Gln) amidotransferase subunit GatC [Phycisphaerae bacterium]|nr:Asp-tRNA(Asn)/Glu-tRNA(Gln) amidotransferase subunit GatC [Phycisphaerae bacterium]